MTASVLKQSLALYFPIICSWQLSSSEKSLVRKKNSSIYLKDFTDFYYRNIFFSFTLTNACYPCRLRPAVLGAANRFVGSETPKYNAFDLFSKNFKDLISISNIFQETHDFLVLTSSVITIVSIFRKSQCKFL